MRRLRLCGLILLVSGLASDAGAQGVRWREDLQAAKQEAAQSGRLVLLHFGATWCGPCKKLENQVFVQPQVAQVIEQHYVPVKLDVDQAKQIARHYKIRPIPADVVITPDGKVVGRNVGYLTASNYVAKMGSIAAAAGVPATADNPLAGQVSTPHVPISPSGSGGLPGGEQEAVMWPREQSPVAPRVGQQFPENPTLGQGPGFPPSGSHPQAPPGGRYSPHPPQAPGHAGEGQPPSSAGQTPPWAIPPQGQSPNPPRRDVTPPPANNQQLPPGYPLYGPPSQREPSAPPQGPPNVPQQPRPTTTPAPQLPPLGFDGFCLISMHDHRAWVRGDPRWGAIHDGRLYFFANLEARNQFLREPLRYAPVFAGYDIVAFAETGQRVQGQRRFGATYPEHKPQIYLFASEANLVKFEQNPAPYVARLRGLGQKVPQGQ